MKKTIFFMLCLFFLNESMNASRHRRTKGLNWREGEENDDDEAGIYTGRQSLLDRIKNNSDEISTSEINKRLAILGEQIPKEKNQERRAKLIADEDYWREKFKSKSEQEKSLAHAGLQGLSKGLLGRRCTSDDTIASIAVEASILKFTAPLKEVIDQKGLTFWAKVFDTLEDGASSLLSLLGFTPTISLNDILRWQTNCQSLADNYKDLRKSIETSESRATSMQLRSLLQDENEDEANTQKETSTLIDPAWKQKRKGDLILLDSIIFKLKIKKAETYSSEYDIHAAIDRLQSDLAGIVEQIESIQVLRDLIDATRTQLMVSYFASIDAGLTELGMIIAPNEFDPSRSRRKKGSSFNHGPYSDF